MEFAAAQAMPQAVLLQALLLTQLKATCSSARPPRPTTPLGGEQQQLMLCRRLGSPSIGSRTGRSHHACGKPQHCVQLLFGLGLSSSVPDCVLFCCEELLVALLGD